MDCSEDATYYGICALAGVLDIVEGCIYSGAFY